MSKCRTDCLLYSDNNVVYSQYSALIVIPGYVPNCAFSGILTFIIKHKYSQQQACELHNSHACYRRMSNIHSHIRIY